MLTNDDNKNIQREWLLQSYRIEWLSFRIHFHLELAFSCLHESLSSFYIDLIDALSISTTYLLISYDYKYNHFHMDRIDLYEDKGRAVLLMIRWDQPILEQRDRYLWISFKQLSLSVKYWLQGTTKRTNWWQIGHSLHYSNSYRKRSRTHGFFLFFLYPEMQSIQNKWQQSISNNSFSLYSIDIPSIIPTLCWLLTTNVSLHRGQVNSIFWLSFYTQTRFFCD